MTKLDIAQGEDGARIAAMMGAVDSIRYQTLWVCEKWSEEACDFARKKLYLPGDAPVGKEQFEAIQLGAEDLVVIEGNLLLNEGIQRMLDLLIAAGGTSYNNANAYIGVGDTATAEAATQTELLATQNAANRFYKAMRTAGFPARPGSNGAQSVDWASDFTSTEANFVWNEWTVSAGATTASGSGFLVGTTNLNRKVASLGTKATGTWTLTSTITFS